MSEQRDLEEQELEEERALRARMHRWLGMLAALLVVVAIAVAVWRLNATLQQSGLGISLWDSLGIGMSTLPWVVLIIVLGIVFSLGTTRIMLGLERLWRLITGKK